MKLRVISEIGGGSPSEDELFASAVANAKPSPMEWASFQELPQVVQHAYLAKFPYESVKEAMIIPARDERGPLYVVRDKNWIEYGFWGDGTDLVHDEEENEFADEDMLDWQMQQHYGTPKDWGF